jgi:hypothetical protein
VRWCARADALFDVAGTHVLGVARDGGRLVLTVESEQSVVGCPGCGVIAVGHGQRRHRVADARHRFPALGGGPAALARAIQRYNPRP